MEFKELGRTGVKVPEIGLGTWDYRGGDAPIKKAVELGACLIDTAEMYGTEEAVGAAIRGMREKVFVATKVSGNHLRHDQVIAAAEASLKRLAIETIDLYQIHWPDPAVPIAETMGAMEKLVDQAEPDEGAAKDETKDACPEIKDWDFYFLGLNPLPSIAMKISAAPIRKDAMAIVGMVGPPRR